MTSCKSKHRRRGFSLPEVIICVIVISVVTIGAIRTSMTVTGIRMRSKDNVALSLHNLNVAEQLRQRSYSKEDGDLLLGYYDEGTFSTSDIFTDVKTEVAEIENYHIYTVDVHSWMAATENELYSHFIMTDIGGTRTLTLEGANS